MGGHQHRWVNGDGQIDILIPEGLGERAKIRGVRGGTTLSTPGAQNVLYRTEPREVNLNGLTGRILRPTLQGALLAKAYAYGVVVDRFRNRHLIDFATLAILVSLRDNIGRDLTSKEAGKLMVALTEAEKNDPALLIEGATEGLARVRAAMDSRKA